MVENLKRTRPGRSKRINLHVTPNEHRKILQAAQAREETVGEFIRAVVLDATRER